MNGSKSIKSPEVSKNEGFVIMINILESIVKINHEIIIVYDVNNEYQYKRFSDNFIGNIRIKLLHNPINCRNNALNLGYSHSKGDIIKCIDADDRLLKSFFLL